MTIDIPRLRALLAAASPGPWECSLDCFDHPPDHDIEACVSDDSTSFLFTAATDVMNEGDGSQWGRARESTVYANAALIAAARNALPQLLDAVESLQRYLANTEAERARWQGRADANSDEVARLDDKVADLEQKLAAAEALADSLTESRLGVAVQDLEADNRALSSKLRAAEQRAERAVEALRKVRKAGPAFPAWDIATRCLRELGDLVEWAPTALRDLQAADTTEEGE